jgi:Uma2 family endonuclease
MVEIRLGIKTMALPFTVRVPDVTEELFNELVDPNTKAELIDGVMLLHSPASLRHDYIANFIRGLMMFYADINGLGVVLGPDGLVRLASLRLFGPDAFLIRSQRIPRPLPKQFEGSPDLAVEVLSPSNRDEDLFSKRPAYQAARVEEIWWIDPELEQVTVDRRRKKGYAETVTHEGRVASSVLRRFWIDASWLWNDPLPGVMTCLEEILGKR